MPWARVPCFVKYVQCWPDSDPCGRQLLRVSSRCTGHAGHGSQPHPCAYSTMGMSPCHSPSGARPCRPDSGLNGQPANSRECRIERMAGLPRCADDLSPWQPRLALTRHVLPLARMRFARHIFLSRMWCSIGTGSVAWRSPACRTCSASGSECN